MKRRVLEASELPSEAALRAAHDRLTLMLWAAQERARLSREMRRDGMRLLANAIRRSGGSAAMN